MSKQIFEFDTVTVDPQGEIIQRTRKQSKGFTENLGSGVVLERVSIPGGTFLMGSPDDEEGEYLNEHPQNEVTVAPFSLGKYPVTQTQWRVVASFPKVESDLNPDPSKFKGANKPVNSVSWFDAVEFCARLSQKTGKPYRLPSEEEWEYACRAGTTTPFHFGETITTDLANYDGSASYGAGPKGKKRGETTEVGFFQLANAFGLYDMHGNMNEWCDSDYSPYWGAPEIIGGRYYWEGFEGCRVLRGGVWNSHPSGCRSAARSSCVAECRLSWCGFRVACS
jgi:formylglycine-generating enzyme required for sulfatase activity